jgi:hypothetical protein
LAKIPERRFTTTTLEPPLAIPRGTPVAASETQTSRDEKWWRNDMPRNSLDPDRVPARARQAGHAGHDLRSLGPSDSSDSGSDLIGPGLIDDEQLGLDRGTNEDAEGGHLAGSDAGASVGDLGADDTSDRYGTGEHLTAGKEPDIRVADDIAPDRIVGADEAGLGGGLDEAEEARLGVVDEELAEGLRRR